MLQHLATQGAQTLLAFNLFITGFFVLFGKSFLRLVFGKDFVFSYFPLLILLIGQLVNSTVGTVGALLNMTGHEKDTAIGMTLSAVINIVLNLTLIPHYGTKGAATATTISMITWSILLWYLVRKRLGINSMAFNFRFGVFKVISR